MLRILVTCGLFLFQVINATIIPLSYFIETQPSLAKPGYHGDGIFRDSEDTDQMLRRSYSKSPQSTKEHVNGWYTNPWFDEREMRPMTI